MSVVRQLGGTTDKGGERVMNKKWYLSKTVWVNAITIASVIAGQEYLNPETQVILLGLVNLILRIVTKKSLNW
jgi:hypothetical protein